MIDFESNLRAVVELLESTQTPYAVIGGLANLVWGEPRSTADIDLCVDLAQMGLADFVSEVSFLGVPLIENPVPFAERNSILPVRTHSGVVVDFALATLPFEIDAISRAIKMNIGTVEARVCTAQDLIIYKVVSERPRDHEDIVGILKRSSASFDLDALEKVVAVLARDLDNPEIAEQFWQAKKSAGIIRPRESK